MFLLLHLILVIFRRVIVISTVVHTIELILCVVFVLTITFWTIHSPTIFRCTTGWNTPSIILRIAIIIPTVIQIIELLCVLFVATITFWPIHSPTIFRCPTGWKTPSIILRRAIIIPKVVQTMELNSLFCFCCYYYFFANLFSNHLHVYNWMEDTFYNFKKSHYHSKSCSYY